MSSIIDTSDGAKDVVVRVTLSAVVTLGFDEGEAVTMERLRESAASYALDICSAADLSEIVDDLSIIEVRRGA